ncbi:hypothetical protein [Gordonia sp. SND2]|uniref:hypothetical protein n=1 Tax=Gordonia sp. SND2 TaxID=3388659 RepID=UPI00398A7218
MPDDIDAEFEATQRIGRRINAVFQAERAVAEPVAMPPEIAARMDAFIDELTGTADDS